MEAVKVLGLACSPRLQGNTQILVEEALQAARELGAVTELYLPAEKSMAPCDGCDFCQLSGECRIDDDMRELSGRMLEADGIIFGSPVYFWNVSAQAKVVIDRTYMFRWERRLRGKAGGALVVSRARGDGTALAAILGFFSANWMVTAAASSAHGDEKGDVRGDLGGMEEARRVGIAVANTARMSVLNARPGNPKS